MSEMKFNYQLFLRNAAESYTGFPIREGQHLMNEIAKYPEVVIPMEYDCFYDNEKVTDFVSYISQYKSQSND